jgi:hypothetical protein
VLVLMCAGPAGLSVPPMTNNTRTHPIRTVAGGAGAVLLCALAFWPNVGQAAGRTQTLRVFSKPVSFAFTSASGKVIHHPPKRDPKPGDVLEINSLDYIGNHRHHARHWTISDHLRCTFPTGRPVCESQVAVDGSLLLFQGFKLTDGTGRYQGATGKAVSKEVKGGSDTVVTIHLH